MVKAFFSLSGELLSLAMQGHAGVGEHGADPVCAACSILAATLSDMVGNGVRCNAFRRDPIRHLAHGEALVSCSPRAEDFEEYLHAYYMAHIGLSLLAREYPNAVSVELVESL